MRLSGSLPIMVGPFEITYCAGYGVATPISLIRTAGAGPGVGAVGVVLLGTTSAYNNLFGEPTPELLMTLAVAELMTEFDTSNGEADGFDCKNLATTPVTCGAAMEVPEAFAAEVSLFL